MKQRHNTPRKSQSPRQRAFDSDERRRVSKQDDTSVPVRVGKEMAVQSFEPEPNAVFSIENAAHLAGVPRRSILIYCKHGLIAPITEPTLWGYWFSADTIRILRRIESLRPACGDDFMGIAMILELMNEVEVLRAQLRSVI